MPSDPVQETPGAAEDLETIWAPQRVGLSVLVALPSAAVSVAVSVVLIAGLIDVSVAVVVLVTVAAVIVTGRVVAWVVFPGRRSVAVSPTSLVVRRGTKIERRMDWADIASLELQRGDSLPWLVLDVTSDTSDFPSILATPRDVWDVRGGFPGLLAFLPAEFRRLSVALDRACDERSVPFTVQQRRGRPVG